MTELVDIHIHLLPAIDDGPRTLEAAVEMVSTAARGGSSVLAATPHLRPDFPRVSVYEIARHCDELRHQVASRGIDVEIVSGAEVSLVWASEASEEELVLASYGQRGRDLLVETPTDATMLEPLLYPLLASGFRVTLAHPSRCEAFQRDPQRVQQLKEQDVLVQVNAESLLAPRGSAVRKTAEYLCRSGLADILASDAHRATRWRPVTSLPAAVAAASHLVGRERAEWMASAAPRAILDAVPLNHAPSVAGRQRRRLTWRHA